MADLFISYARADREFAQCLAAALESRGWSVWWDRRLHGGQSFDRIIEEAISTAKAVVVLWSKESVDSDWVRAEASYGLEANKLVPVRIDSTSPPLRYRNIHTSDLASWIAGGDAPSLEDLCSDLKFAIESSGHRKVDVLEPNFKRRDATAEAPTSDARPHNVISPDTNTEWKAPSRPSREAPLQAKSEPVPGASGGYQNPPFAGLPDALPQSVRVIGVLLIVQALVRFGFMGNLLSQSSSAALANPQFQMLNILVPVILACGGIITGILALRRFPSSRGFGLTVCALGLVFQIYALDSGLYFMSAHPSINVPMFSLFHANTILYFIGLFVFGLWRRQVRP